MSKYGFFSDNVLYPLLTDENMALVALNTSREIQFYYIEQRIAIPLESIKAVLIDIWNEYPYGASVQDINERAVQRLTRWFLNEVGWMKQMNHFSNTYDQALRKDWSLGIQPFDISGKLRKKNRDSAGWFTY